MFAASHACCRLSDHPVYISSSTNARADLKLPATVFKNHIKPTCRELHTRTQFKLAACRDPGTNDQMASHCRAPSKDNNKNTNKESRSSKPPIGQFAGLKNKTEQRVTAQSRAYTVVAQKAAWVLSY